MKVKKLIVMMMAAMLLLTGCGDGAAQEESTNEGTQQESSNENMQEESSNENMQGSTENTEMIDSVKNGYPQIIPEITYDQAYSHFFSDPEWRYFDATDGSNVVEFSGGCTYNEEPAKVYIQFVVSGDEFDIFCAKITVNDETINASATDLVDLTYKPFSSYAEEVLGEPLNPEVEEQYASMYEEAFSENAYE